MLASHIKSRPKRQVPTEAKGLVKAWLRVGLWRIEIRASVGLMVKCKTVGLTPNRRLLSVAGADDGEKHPLRWLAVNLEVSFQGSISPGTSQLIRATSLPLFLVVSSRGKNEGCSTAGLKRAEMELRLPSFALR
jgi:hypothetical protein